MPRQRLRPRKRVQPTHKNKCTNANRYVHPEIRALCSLHDSSDSRAPRCSDLRDIVCCRRRLSRWRYCSGQHGTKQQALRNPPRIGGIPHRDTCSDNAHAARRADRNRRKQSRSSAGWRLCHSIARYDAAAPDSSQPRRSDVGERDVHDHRIVGRALRPAVPELPDVARLGRRRTCSGAAARLSAYASGGIQREDH